MILNKIAVRFLLLVTLGNLSIGSSLTVFWSSTPALAQISDVTLLAPTSSGQQLQVIHGYNDPLPSENCAIGSASDHCNNQRYGLDLKPSDQDKLEILAPLPGKIGWGGNGTTLDCLGITTQDNLNLTICHFGTFSVQQFDTVQRGQVLGTRRTNWIHISLDDRGKNPWQPIPFNGVHAIEGRDLNPPANEASDRDVHRNEVLVSTNGAVAPQ